MCVAKDRESHVKPGRLTLWFLALALSLNPGCARMQSFRQPTDPLAAHATPPAPRQQQARLLQAQAAANPRFESGLPQDGYAAWLEGRTRPDAATSAPPGTTVRATRPAPPTSTLGRLPEITVAVAPPEPVVVSPLPNVQPIQIPDPLITASRNNQQTQTQPQRGNNTPPPVDDLAIFRQVTQEARNQLSTLTSYQLDLERQEVVDDILQPAEVVTLSILRNPRCVRLEWREGPNQSREVLYQEGGQMHVKMPNPIMPRVSLAPDSPLALRNSRHPISEAGLDTIVSQLELTVQRHEARTASSDSISYGGVESPFPGAPPCHKLERLTATGETWLVYLDEQTHLPFLVQGNDARQNLLERYVFRNIRPNLPELASTSAFDPNQRWGASTGLLDRLARSLENPKTPDQTTNQPMR